MNTHNFKIFVEALEALPQQIKNREVDMQGIDKPTPHNRSDFGGLISIVAENIEGLPEAYKTILDDANAHDTYGKKDTYNSNIWTIALGDFLGESFTFWAEANQAVWGNHMGYFANTYKQAFGKEDNETLTNNDIIIYLRGVFERHIKSKGAN